MNSLLNFVIPISFGLLSGYLIATVVELLYRHGVI